MIMMKLFSPKKRRKRNKKSHRKKYMTKKSKEGIMRGGRLKSYLNLSTLPSARVKYKKFSWLNFLKDINYLV